jgi:hypothetical protein
VEESIMKFIISLVIGAAVLAGPAALAQSTGQENSGAGVAGQPGGKSGPAVTPSGKNATDQGTTSSQDESKVPGLPGSKSGPAQQPAKN